MDIPYIGPIDGLFSVGSTIKIHGNVLPYATRFAINLQCGPNIYPRDDVALHFSPDFGRGCVIRNNILQNNWGPEEYVGPFPFIRGKSFEVVITCDDEGFRIAVDGQHLATFSHRIPYKRITHIAVDGEITLGGIHHSSSSMSQIGFSVGSNQNSLPPYPSPCNPPPYPVHGDYQSSPYNLSHPPPYPYSSGTLPSHGQYLPQQAPTQNLLYPTQHGTLPPSYQQANLYSTQTGIIPQVSPSHSPKHNKSGILDKAGMALAGTLTGGGLMGAMMHGKKGLKSQKKAHKKALKYGLPIAGVGLGAYALKKGFHRSSSSSSSSSD